MTPNELLHKAEQALKSAHLLCETGDPDGACNRAYYAMFDAARAALLSEGLDSGKTHKGLINQFSERWVKSGRIEKDVGRFLKHAETVRYIADYDGASIGLEDAKLIIDQAEVFVGVVSAIVTRAK